MDYKSATNPDTGEKVFLVNNEWVKPAKTATNPDTGSKAYLISNEWYIPGVASKPPEPPKTENRTGEIVSDVGKSLAATAVTMGTQLPQALFSREKKATELATAAPYEALNLLGGQTNLLDALRKSYGFKTEEKEKQPTIVSEAQEKFAKPVQEAAAQAYIPGTREFAKLGSDYAQKINSTMSAETRRQLENSVPTWDIAKGELPSLGKEPTMLGYGMQFLNVLESQAPVLAAAMRGKNMTERIGNAANMGQRLSTGEGMGEARGYIDKLSDEELAKASPEFVSLSKTMGPKKARDLVTDKAMMDAGVAQGVVGRFGAEITGGLLSGKFDKFALDTIKNKAGRIALGTAGGAGEQGLEEAAEGIAADIGVNKTVVKEVGAGAFANLVFGALGGGPVGAYTAAKAKPETPVAPPQYEQNEQGTFVPVDKAKQGSVTLGPIEDAQKQLDLQGGEATTLKKPFQLAGGPGKYAAMAAAKNVEDPQKTTELRNQFDTIEQELSRLQTAYETEQDPAKRQAILVQAQKLDFARQEVESQLKPSRVSPRSTTQEGQGELFAPEQASMQQVTPLPQNAVQGDLFSQQEAPAKIVPETNPVEQTKQDEIQRQIFALQQGPQSNKVRAQIADLQSQLEKGPGANLDYLKTEYDAIQRALPILEEQRKNTKKLDDKLKITKQINQAKARAGELLKQGVKSAEQLEPTEETKGLNLSDTINEDHFKEMGINKTNKKIRALLEGKSLSNPDDRAFIIQTLTDYASNPNRSASVSTKVDNFLNSLKPIQENQDGSITGINTGAVEPSIPVPREGNTPTEGLAALIDTGVENNLGTSVGLGTGTPPLQNVQPNTLSFGSEPPNLPTNFPPKNTQTAATITPIEEPQVTSEPVQATSEPTKQDTERDVIVSANQQADTLFGKQETLKSAFAAGAFNAINDASSNPVPGIQKKKYNRKESKAFDDGYKYAQELMRAKELFGEDSDKGIALLRSGLTLDDALKAIGLQRTQKTPTTKEGIEAQKNSDKFNAGVNPPPHQGRFAGIQRKLNAVRQGNLNIGSLIFGNAQNFASNTQAYVNLMRKVMLDMEKSGVLTREQASLAFYRIMGTQATQRATLALQMMTAGAWNYDPKKAWYDTKVDPKVNMNMYDAQVPLLAERLGVDKETALKYIDEALEASRLDGFFKKQTELKKEIATSEQIKAGLEAIKDRTKGEDKQLKNERFVLNKLKKDLDRYEKKAMHRTPENVAAGMEHLKHPEVQKAVDIWQEMRKRTIKEMVDSGLLTEEKAEDWLDEAAYVPFFRDLDLSTEKITQQQIFSKGLRESTAPLRAKQVGSMEKLTSPSTNAKQWMSWALASSISNRQVNNMIQQYKTFLPDDIKEGDDPKKSSFAVMENGEEKYYNVADADIAQAFMREATYVFPMMAQFKAVSNFGRKAITRNPIFSLTQIPMDLYAALFTSGVDNQLGLLGNTLAEAIKTPFNLSVIRKDMIASGMLNTHDWNAFDDENSAKIASKVKDPSYFAKAMHVLEKAGAYSDNIVRQGVATQLINEGKTREEAYTIAAEIINFRNRSGVTALNSLSQSTMFFNSWLQAVAITMKTLSGQGLGYQTRVEGLKLLTNNFAKVAAFSFFWAALQGGVDDEEVYGKKSRKTRDRVFIIPGTEGVSIPIRQDIFAIPHFLAQDAYNVVMDKTYTDPKMVKDSLKDAFSSAFTPPSYGLMQAVKIPFEVGLNKDIHTGQDIVPKYMQDLEPYLQYNQSTGELAKTIGELTNISPLKIQHALKGFTGSLITAFDLFADSFISQEKGIEKPAQTWRETLAKIPSAGPVIGSEKNMSAVSDFYEVKKDVDRVIATYKKLATMDEKQADAYLAKHEDEVIKVKNVEKGFTNIKKYENYILEAKIGTKFDDGTPVTPKTKAEKLKEINAYKDELGESVKEIRKHVYKGF
jgi:hypothetical protein